MNAAAIAVAVLYPTSDMPSQNSGRGSTAARATCVLLVVAATSACAGSTLGSGVGDRLLDEPPYYAGRLMPIDSQSFGVLPIGFQAGATQSPIFEPAGAEGSAIAGLLADMNAYVASLDLGVVLVRATDLPGRATDVMLRCETDAVDECAFPEEGGEPQMHLAVARPSGEWATGLAALLDEAGASHALLITLEVSDYWTYQRNLRGSKEVRLGANHVVDVPWLTSLETPVSVLQLTGAILGPDGKAVRIGAEGLLARRSSLLVSAIGGQALIRDEDVEALRTRVRADLPGEPLVWQAALATLVGNLTGRLESDRR